MRMFFLISYFVFSLSFSVYAQGKTSKDDFNKKVQLEVERQVSLIKKKSISQLAIELLKKETALKEKENTLLKREEQISNNEVSLLKQIEALEKTKGKIIGCLDEHEKGELVRIKKMVEVVSNMKPKKAADLLSIQEPGISIKIIEKIDPKKASKIFNLMEKEVSARLQKQYLSMQQ